LFFWLRKGSMMSLAVITEEEISRLRDLENDFPVGCDLLKSNDIDPIEFDSFWQEIAGRPKFKLFKDEIYGPREFLETILDLIEKMAADRIAYDLKCFNAKVLRKTVLPVIERVFPPDFYREVLEAFP